MVGFAKNQRNSNLEILRIIAIVLIVAHHWAFHGFQNIDLVASNPNTYIIYFLTIFGKVGVNLFIILSAYFMVTSNFTIRKFLVVSGEVYFYSILFLVLFLTVLTPVSPISGSSIVSSILPVSHSAYWFITDYLMLMILSPFLNKFISILSKHNYLNLLGLTLLMWCIYPTFTGHSFEFNSIFWFIVLYLIGGFIRLHVNLDKFSFKKLIVTGIISIIVCYVLYAGVSTAGLLLGSGKILEVSKLLYGENSLFVLIVSIVLFIIFLKRKEFSNKYINYIAGSVLGVYLIHENMYFRPFLWKVLLKNSTYYNSPSLIIFAIVSIIGIFLICTGIDIIRRLTIEKLWILILDAKLDNLVIWIKNKFMGVSDKLLSYLY